MPALFLLFACTGGAPDTGDTAAEAPLSPIVQFLQGDSQYSDATGTPRGDPSETLLRRTVNPQDASLEEYVITVDHRDVATYTVLGTIDPAAATWTFSFADSYGTLGGDGAFLAGDTWAWTQWQSTSTYMDGTYAGTYVTSEDSVSAEGLVANKVIHNAGGDATGSIVETLALVSEADWTAREEELLAR
jgi:hypothetical protein